MARNYMMGHLMTQLDGPFSSMDFIKSMKIESLENAQFANMIDEIQACTPARLRDLANAYMDLDEWITVIVK